MRTKLFARGRNIFTINILIFIAKMFIFKRVMNFYLNQILSYYPYKISTNTKIISFGRTKLIKLNEPINRYLEKCPYLLIIVLEEN